MSSLRICAKLNLVLEVLGRRADGYHELATVFHSLNLTDTLTVSPAAALHVLCARPELSGRANAAWSAARLLRSQAGLGIGARIEIEKRIPIAAGLGGGSADAAGALLLLNRFWRLDWPNERLMPLAAALGADVPFCLQGGCALAGGRGDELAPLPPLQESWCVLLVPPFALEGKTARLYALLGPEHYTDGSRAARLAQEIAQGRPLEPGLLFNAFDAVAEWAYPGIDRYRDALQALGAPSPHLCGSGPALFALAPDQRAALRWAQALRDAGHEAYAVPLVPQAAVFS
jgi:4-diphosphocytidyl-2-C-methyl-D-erythritol kinase